MNPFKKYKHVFNRKNMQTVQEKNSLVFMPVTNTRTTNITGITLYLLDMQNSTAKNIFIILN